jgi:hypothetical protein
VRENPGPRVHGTNPRHQLAGESRTRGHSVRQIFAQLHAVHGEAEAGLAAVTLVELAHGIERAERGVTLPFEDLLIGATALHLGFAVVTENIRHFAMIPDLEVKQL